MKTHFKYLKNMSRRLRGTALACMAALAILLGASSCETSGAYWGVDQAYPVGNGQVYYGAYGGDGHHHHYSKKQYKKYKKQQKKLRKQREKYYKHQQKKYKKHHKKYKHHHHDDD